MNLELDLSPAPVGKVNLPLNAGQQAAADGFFDFLLSDRKELSISGPGGVGKTFLMGHMIDTVMPRYFQACELMGIEAEYDDVIMCATTNKAAEILSTYTGRSAQTVHSEFGLKVVDDFSTGESKATKSNAWHVSTKKIFFIDEASMIDSQLYEFIQEGTLRCKIVYLGDHCQLAPVKEKISPVYKRKIQTYVLTEPMRNATQPKLQELCTAVRETVETGVFGPIQLVPGIIDWLDDDQMEAEVGKVFSKQSPENRILAYTNNRVIAYNDYIRSIRQLPAEYQVGEYLINNSAIRLGKTMLSVEDELEIISMDDFTTNIEVENDVELTVRKAVLKNQYGELLYEVKLPTDRDHYAALIKYYKKLKNWNRFYFLKNNFPDLRQRDACTVYKAQGSSCDTVYIDLTDLSTCHNPDQAARLLYVGVSRARYRVVFYGNLAPKYGQLIQ